LQCKKIEKEQVIQSKETIIKDLRNTNVHLENFRFDLDNKIATMQEERVDLEKNIIYMQGYTKELYTELMEEEKNRRNATEEKKIK
jgi:hypothetical protein